MTYSASTELTKRRAVLQRRLERSQAVQISLGADIAQIDDAIRQIEEIKAKAKLESVAQQRDKLTRTLLDAMRTSPEPMTLRALALVVMEQRGLGASDAKAVSVMIERVRVAMARQRKKGVVRGEFGKFSKAVEWTLA